MKEKKSKEDKVPKLENMTLGLGKAIGTGIFLISVGAGYAKLENKGTNNINSIKNIDSTLQKEVKRLDGRIDKSDTETKSLGKVLYSAVGDIKTIKESQKNTVDLLREILKHQRSRDRD